MLYGSSLRDDVNVQSVELTLKQKRQKLDDGGSPAALGGDGMQDRTRQNSSKWFLGAEEES